MSAAEPVRPPGTAKGRVIHLGPRRVPPPDSTPPHDADTPVVSLLAATVEAMFLEEGMTLTDPDTAAAFDVTMSAVLLLVDGAQEEGVLERDAYGMIRKILDDMRATPRQL
ncbi:hypothetical protein [Streptomyces sp. NPDC101145]|uniref:hypothetical protein n=1 Tax=Streptomyces sp. NPDC101145 TaxID=3366112 RepID=UPI0038095F49